MLFLHFHRRMALGKPDATKLSVSRTRHRILCKSNVVNMLIHIHLAELWIQPSKKGDTEIAKRRHEDLKMPYFQRVWRLVNTVQVLFPAPPLNANFDTKLAFIFLQLKKLDYANMALFSPDSLLICNNQPCFSQIAVFLPLASLHESSDFCFHRPQIPLSPGKNAPYSGRLPYSSTIKSSRV